MKDFHATWGNKWANVVGECDRERLVYIWAQETKCLKNEEVAKAIRACRRKYTFPPSIHEFLCAAYDFYSPEEAFDLAWKFEIGQEEPYSVKDYILARARIAVDYIFSTVKAYNPYCASNEKEIPYEEKVKIWNKQYKNEINDFLMRDV